MRYAKPWYRKSKSQWFVQINGKQIPLGKGKREAMRQYHRLMDKGPATGELPVRKLLDAYHLWLKANRADSTVTRRKPLLESFGNFVRPTLRIRDLKGFHVESWIASGYAEANSTTRNIMITAIKAALSWGVKQGYADSNPIATLEKPAANIRQEFLPVETWPQVLALTNGPFNDFLTVMLDSGARPQEMFKFEAKHYRDSRFTLPIADSKGKKKSRVVYLPETARKIVEKLVKHYPEGKLFRNTKDIPYCADSIKCSFGRLKAKLKAEGIELDSLCATTLRHSFAHHRLTSGQDSLTVSKLLGHADGRMVATRYGHIEANADFMQAEASRIVFPLDSNSSANPQS
jgi:integrase